MTRSIAGGHWKRSLMMKRAARLRQSRWCQSWIDTWRLLLPSPALCCHFGRGLRACRQPRILKGGCESHLDSLQCPGDHAVGVAAAAAALVVWRHRAWRRDAGWVHPVVVRAGGPVAADHHTVNLITAKSAVNAPKSTWRARSCNPSRVPCNSNLAEDT